MKNIATLFLLMVALQQSTLSQSLVWARAMGGDYSDIAYAVTTDADGNVYTTGSFRLTVDFDPGVGVYELTAIGNTDIFVSKLDADGNFLWAVNMGGTTSANGEAITINSDGNCVITGNFSETVDFDPSDAVFNLTAVNGAGMFVVILGDTGNLVWAGAMSGQGFLYSAAVAIDATGNIVIAGFFGNSCDFDPNAGESIIATAEGSAFVVKLQADGTFMWARHIEGAAASNVNCWDMALDSDDNILLAGSFSGTVDFNMGAGAFELTSAGSTDIYVCKLDANGDFLWAAGMGNGSADTAFAVDTDSDDNVHVSGNFIHTVDFDPGPDVYTVVSASTSDHDTFVWKLTAAGSFVWARGLGGDDNEFPTSIAVDAAGKVYTVGGFDGACDFDPGVGVFELEPASVTFYDIYISVLDVNGEFVWAGSIGSTGNDRPEDVTVDAQGHPIVCGSFTLTVDMDPTASEYELTGVYDAFVLKLSAIENDVAENTLTYLVDAFPNPTSNFFTLETTAPAKTAYIITDIKGSIIHSGNTSGKITTIDLSSIENGVYFLHVEDRVVKLVKK